MLRQNSGGFQGALNRAGDQPVQARQPVRKSMSLLVPRWN